MISVLETSKKNLASLYEALDTSNEELITRLREIVAYDDEIIAAHERKLAALKTGYAVYKPELDAIHAAVDDLTEEDKENS